MTARSPLILGMVLAILGSGCVDSDTFYIIQMQVPTASGGGCAATPSQSGVYLGAGALDISLNMGYIAFPLLLNNMESSATIDSQPERNNLHLKGYRVSLDLGEIPISPDDKLVDFFVNSSGTITPSGGLQVGPVEVIKPELVKLLVPAIPPAYEPVILVKMRAVATRGGWETESAEFTFPVTICSKCLVDYRATCPATGDKTVLINACGLPQDSPVTCCPLGTSSSVKCYNAMP
jgi:hypothetical protein